MRAGDLPWRYISSREEIRSCERDFLGQAGKSQDGLASRYLNRPLSSLLSRWLVKLPITPNAWSILIFTLPVARRGISPAEHMSVFWSASRSFSSTAFSTAAMARSRARNFSRPSLAVDSTASSTSPVICFSRLALASASNARRLASAGSISPKASPRPRSRSPARVSSSCVVRVPAARVPPADGTALYINAITSLSRVRAFSSSARTQPGGWCSSRSATWRYLRFSSSPPSAGRP